MKLMFFVFAFLLGVILTYANNDKSIKEIHTNESLASGGGASQASDSVLPQPGGLLNAEKDTKPAAPLFNNTNLEKSKSNDPAKLTDVKQTEKEPQKSKTELPAGKPTAVSSESIEPTTPATPSMHINAVSSTAGDWNVIEGDSTCIKVHGFISLNVTSKTTAHNVTFTVDILPQTPINGSCKNEFIRWNLSQKNNVTESLQLQFSQDTKTKKYYLSRVDGLFFYPHSNELFGFKNDTIKAFVTPSEQSYLCRKSVVEPLVHKEDADVVLIMKDFQIQAFKTSKSHGFDESIDGCPSGGHGTPDIVPIVVGCALALLVVMVLVAYLVNRRRSQAHGYLSM